MTPAATTRQAVLNGRVVVTRLRPGPNALPADEVSSIQRARILEAMAEVACEQGVEAASVARVIRRARVSRRTFYDLFSDRCDCVLALFDETVERATAIVREADSAESGWVQRVRAGLHALLEFIDDERDLLGLCIAQALAGEDPRLRRRRERVLRELAVTVEQGRAAGRGVKPLPLTAEAVVGAGLSILHGHLQSEDPAPLASLLGPLMGLIVLPYLGAAAARRAVACPAPSRRARLQPPRQRALPDPLLGLGTRITYRTLCVIGVIAAHPGLCNREVAERAGVADAGQMSKLLSRLRAMGLLENRGAGYAAGAGNEWHLTPAGKRVWHATSFGRPDAA